MLENDDVWSESSSRPTSPLYRRTTLDYNKRDISPIKLDPCAQPFKVHSSMNTSDTLKTPSTDSSILSTDPNLSIASTSSNISAIDQGNGSFPRHKKWITEEILEMIAVRDKLYKRTKSHPSPDIVNMYKKVSILLIFISLSRNKAKEPLPIPNTLQHF